MVRRSAGQVQGQGPERRERFTSTSGYDYPALAGPWSAGAEDTDSSYLDQLGFPGSYPFTRGVQPTMYRGRFWTMRQYAGFCTAQATNERYHFLLNSGQTGLSRGLRPADADGL